MVVDLRWLKDKVKKVIFKESSISHQEVTLPGQSLRRSIAWHYLAGEGIEIGALHSPLEIPPQARVRYVDRLPVSELRAQYRELAECPLVEVDIIDDGETLASIANESLDFVIANHMIEHCQNPLGTLEQHLRVLKPGGILYVAIPDQRYTFDRDRPLTPLEHIIRDYQEGPEWSKYSHFEEWVRLVNKTPEEQQSQEIQHLINMNYSIHFHVWRATEFTQLLIYCQKELGFNFEIELMQKNGIEFIFILRKNDAKSNNKS